MKASILLQALMAAVVAGTVVPVVAGTDPTAAEQAAMGEYWRHAPRYGCLCCSVYVPAPKAAVVPRGIGSLPVVEARLYGTKGRLACFAAAGRRLWAADDTAVYQIDTQKRAVVRTFTIADGLPDVPVRQLVPDGRRLWIVGTGRLARLDIAAGKIDLPRQPPFALARMAVGPAGSFLVTERQAYRWNETSGTFEPLGAYPGQQRVAKAVERGFWQHVWYQHTSSLLRDAAVGREELYVLAENTLSRFDRSSGWKELARGVWRIAADGSVLWAVTTDGLLRCEAGSGKVQAFTAASARASGRPIDLVLAGGAAWLMVEPRFDKKANRFAGGGICRLDPRSGEWANTDRVDQTDVSFPTAAAADGGEVLVAVRLVGGVDHRSLHPGMARVRRHVPRIDGLAVAVRGQSGTWRAVPLKGLEGEFRWVMGQHRRRGRDRVRPQRITRLLACGGRLWAAMQNFPEKYYGGYFESVQCIARRQAGGWVAVADRPRAASVGLAGEHPGILCLTATHGSPVVLAHGHPRMLGLVRCGHTVWVVHEGGVWAYDGSADEFRPVLAEPIRAYWQVTAAASAPSAVWFGSDAGTITRFDRKAGRFELLGIVPGRKVTQMRTGDGQLWVSTAASKAVLPPALSGVQKLPAADVLRYDGKRWSDAGGSPLPAAAAVPYAFKRSGRGRAAYLTGPAGGEGRSVDLAFVKGIFEPGVLCADGPDTLWIKVWCGVGRLSLSGLLAKGKADQRGGQGEEELGK